MTRKHPKQETSSLASGDLATARRYWFQDWYRKLGFNLSIPFPPISDEEFKRRKELGQDLFFRPSTLEVSHEALMKALGQDGHWTVVDENDRKKIVWEPTQTGYWFWAEVAQDCPRLKTPWKTLVKKQKLNLLSLEEYVVVWWAHRAGTNIMLDTKTWSWLRTRFGRSALDADECYGWLCVTGWDGSDLADSFGLGGGRVAEVVQNAT